MPQWNEVSEGYADGNDRRTFQICKINKPKPNYWFRTIYLETKGAKALYVEVEFTVRFVVVAVSVVIVVAVVEVA